MEYNLKPREVWCSICKKYLDSIEPTPKCPVCDSLMITVVYSVTNGNRVTGNSKDGLGQASS